MEEAIKELNKRQMLDIKEAIKMHSSFLADQLPYVDDMLEHFSSEDLLKPYKIIDEYGIEISGITTVKDSVNYLKKSSQEALSNKQVTSSFYTNHVIDILSLHYSLWKNLDFSQFDDFKTYHSRLNSNLQRPKGRFDESAYSTLSQFSLTPIVKFLNKILEVKKLIRSQTNDGILLWPTFSHLTSEDFKTWHLGIKPVAITLDRYLTFDGNTSDFFELATHDVTNHTVSKAILPHKKEFSKFQDLFFSRLSTYSPLEQEVLNKIWFLSTHEGTQVMYRLFLLNQQTPNSILKSTQELQSSLYFSVLYEDNNVSNLASQLKSELYFYNELSKELRLMSLDEIDQLVKKSWSVFIKIYSDSMYDYFTNKLG